MIQNHTIQNIQLASKQENLVQIESFIDEVCEQFKIKEDHYGNILIALTEAVNNAITHGNDSDPTKMVNLNMEAKKEGVEFTIQDEGPGFDYDNIPDPTLPENIEKLNGRGIFLMKNLADDVVFEENGSVIKLKFSLPSN